jgi:hypothetical protein
VLVIVGMQEVSCTPQRGEGETLVRLAPLWYSALGGGLLGILALMSLLYGHENFMSSRRARGRLCARGAANNPGFVR